MSFNSFEFLLFFPIAIILFYLTPHKYRWGLLLGASYYFYASANGKLLFLLIFSTLIDYFVGLKMEKLETKKKRKPYLTLSLVLNLGLLCLFKYYNFFIDSFLPLFEFLNIEYAIPTLHLILPVGISFYTLQTLAYSIDVYNGKQQAERHIGYFALYVCYFPQLVAGPIERASNLIPQFKQRTKIDPSQISNGLKLMGFGFFKKVVIADQIAPLISYVTDNPSDFEGFSILLCSCLFAYQIYCDFSGYSDIAIGGAQIMGIKLMENFRRPFVAKSISELWRRWHISLIQWFRDYIFIPLSGSRASVKKIYISSLIVFIISGLWHGPAWSFIIWGALNGLVIIFSRVLNIKKHSMTILGKSRKTIWYNTFLKLKTFLLFSSLGILFYVNDLDSVITMYSNFAVGWGNNIKEIFVNTGGARSHILFLGSSAEEFIILVGSILVLEIIQFFQERYGSVRKLLSSKPLILRWSLYTCLIFSVILFSFDSEATFIYFQF